MNRRQPKMQWYDKLPFVLYGIGLLALTFVLTTGSCRVKSRGEAKKLADKSVTVTNLDEVSTCKGPPVEHGKGYLMQCGMVDDDTRYCAYGFFTSDGQLCYHILLQDATDCFSAWSYHGTDCPREQYQEHPEKSLKFKSRASLESGVHL